MQSPVPLSKDVVRLQVDYDLIEAAEKGNLSRVQELLTQVKKIF